VYVCLCVATYYTTHVHKHLNRLCEEINAPSSPPSPLFASQLVGGPGEDHCAKVGLEFIKHAEEIVGLILKANTGDCFKRKYKLA
jgi:hypothetical protein